MHPVAFAKFFGGPGNAGFPTFDRCKRDEAIDALTNAGQFSAYRNEFALACGFRLTYSNEVFHPRCRMRMRAGTQDER